MTNNGSTTSGILKIWSCMVAYIIVAPSVVNKTLICCVISQTIHLPSVMGTLVNFICIVVASFAIQAQRADTTLPLAYPAQVLQGDGSQTCPTEEQEENTRKEIENATLILLQDSVVPLLQNFSCGGSTGWRRVAYLNMSDPSQQCPSVWREYTTPYRVCGRNSTTGSCEGVNYTTGSE